MRVMVLVKATNDSEAGIMPSTEQQVGEQCARIGAYSAFTAIAGLLVLMIFIESST